MIHRPLLPSPSPLGALRVPPESILANEIAHIHGMEAGVVAWGGRTLENGT